MPQVTHPTLTDLALALDDARRELARAQRRVDEAQRELDAAVEDERRRREAIPSPSPAREHP